MANVLPFPREVRVNIAMQNLAKVYERARAMGTWQRSPVVRAVWLSLLEQALRKANG